MDGLEEQYQGRLAVQRIDANRGDGPEIVRERNILGHPTILLLNQNGDEIGRLLGPQTTEGLVASVEQLLAATAE